MSVYENLNLRSVINADATLTRLGGSLMPPEVLQAMEQASRSFVDMYELQRQTGDRIATLTHNEAAFVTSGAAAGLYLATLACGLTTNPEDGVTIYGRDRNQTIIQRSQRNAYVPSIELSGATIIEIGDGETTSAADFVNAINERTLATIFFAGHHLAHGALPLPEVIEIAHSHGLPVVVDGAAQLPPVDNLWRFTRDMGADLAIFSGGKGLRGPQSSGLIVGRKDLIEICRTHGSPNQHRGRPMKVGKEEMAGLLAAVERYLNLDFAALSARYESQVRTVLDAVSEFPEIAATRDWPSEAGQPIPRARISIAPHAATIQSMLWEGDPRIAVAIDGDANLLVNPETLEPGQEVTVAERLVESIDTLLREQR